MWPPGLFRISQPESKWAQYSSIHSISGTLVLNAVPEKVPSHCVLAQMSEFVFVSRRLKEGLRRLDYESASHSTR